MITVEPKLAIQTDGLTGEMTDPAYIVIDSNVYRRDDSGVFVCFTERTERLPNASHTGTERTERRRIPNAWQSKLYPAYRTPNTERIAIRDIHHSDA